MKTESGDSITGERIGDGRWRFRLRCHKVPDEPVEIVANAIGVCEYCREPYALRGITTGVVHLHFFYEKESLRHHWPA